MISLLFIIIVILLIVLCVEYCSECDFSGTAPFCILAFIIAFLPYMLIGQVDAENTIDAEIAMYQEENASIEQSIDLIVKNYIEVETSIYEKFKDENPMNVVSIFSELREDTLVQKQIELHVENNKKIKELKEEKIRLSKIKWLLYLG